MMIMNRTDNTFLARRWFFWSLFAIGLAAVVPGKFSAAQSNDRPEANAATSSDDQWARLSPFTRVQVDGDEVDVVYNGKWYSLKSIAGSSTEQILESAREQFGDLWEKRFVEDLVEVLTGMGHEVGKSVELELIDPKTNEVTMVSGAPLTSENRRFVYSAYQEQQRAQQIPKNTDETKIHELIKRFAKAAGAGDTDEVFNTLHPARGTDRVDSYINSSREMQEMNIEVSKLKLVEVMPEQGQAFAATDFFPFHPAGGESRCVVFNCKLDEGTWKIRDIDLEDLEGYSHEFLRFVDRARKTESNGN